ncbi:MAG: GTP 3',8-cyclase MoaA [Candidatus Glassbacteria bacterium]
MINYLRISVTDRCNLRCLYCHPEGVVGRGELLSFEEIYQIAQAAVLLGIKRIRLTGGEPTVRRGLLRLIEMLSSLDGLKELTLTTNGLLLFPMTRDLKAAGLSRVNVSLDTLDPEKYVRITGVDGHSRVLQGINAARKCGLEPVKINMVAMKGINDDEIEKFVLYAMGEGIRVRFIEMMPFHCNKGLQKEHFLSAGEILGVLQQKFSLVESGGGGPGPARYYSIGESVGLIGLITPFSRPFCASCNRLRLTSRGGLRNCLFSDHELDLRAHVRTGAGMEELSDLIRSSISMKGSDHHHLIHGEPGCNVYSISQIGG